MTILRDESRSHRLQFAACDSDANSSARAYLPIAGVASGLGDAEGHAVTSRRVFYESIFSFYSVGGVTDEGSAQG